MLPTKKPISFFFFGTLPDKNMTAPAEVATSNFEKICSDCVAMKKNENQDGLKVFNKEK